MNESFEFDKFDQCGRRLDDGVEWISRLPDDIIVYILSFLPLKDAVATSLVSRRWSHLWKYTPNLIFKNDPFLDPMINIPVTVPKHKEHDPYLEQELKNIEWVNSVVESHKALSLKQFEISFSLTNFRVLTKWLHFALSRRVERLKLNFHCANSTILDCKMLSRLPSSDFKFLRELKLKDLYVSGEAIGFFLCNCSLLERLIITGMLTSDLMVDSTTLKYLYITRQRREVSTKVSAPNLTRLDGIFDVGSLFLENVPNLVEASFYRSKEDTADHIAKAAAKFETLTLALNCPKAFAFPQMARLLKLVVDYYKLVNEDFLVSLTCLLEASPCLREFRLNISDIRRYISDFPHQASILEVPEPRNESAQHEHLNVFEFSMFCGIIDEHVELLRYIVDSCAALRDVVISPIPPVIADYSAQREDANNPYRLCPSSPAMLATEKRDAALKIKKLTEQQFAGKLPHHIKLHVYMEE